MGLRSVLVGTAVVLAGSVAGAQNPAPRPLAGSAAPVYPAAAAADAMIGRVEFEVRVKRDGTPGSIRTVYAAPRDSDFEKAAKKAVERWRFERPADAAAPYKARFRFRPSTPVAPRWQQTPGSSVAYSDGRRVLELKGGWIRTPRWFSEFVLDLEFRVAGQTPRAHLLVHVAAVRDGRHIGYVVPLADARGEVRVGDVMGELPFRRLDTGTAPVLAATAAAGGWQTVRIETLNGVLRVIMNGVPTFAATDLARGTGHVGLEVRDGVLEVRSAQIERRDTYMDGPADTAAVRSSDPGVTGPEVVTEVKPEYAMDAMRRVILGTVWLEAVALPDGSVDAVRVTKSLDLDLDQSAVAAVRRWKFRPGTRHGTPVPVQVDIEMTFVLK
jgi:TonB family protein